MAILTVIGVAAPGAAVANLDVTHEHEIVVLGLGVGWGL